LDVSSTNCLRKVVGIKEALQKAPSIDVASSEEGRGYYKAE
jgi:hypothetical protein